MKRILLAALAAGTVVIAFLAVLPSFGGPEQEVTRYVAAAMRGDAGAATAAWPVAAPTDPRLYLKHDLLARRRAEQTAALVAAAPRSYRVVGIEWWRTCCEPGTLPDGGYAGLARVRVAIETREGQREMVFDVRRTNDCCTFGFPDTLWQRWVLRDAYPPTKDPIELPWVSAGAAHYVPWPPEP